MRRSESDNVRSSPNQSTDLVNFLKKPSRIVVKRLKSKIYIGQKRQQ